MWTSSRDGVRIAFEVVGRGRPLVLLHGFYGDRTTWHQSGHVKALADDDHRLILIAALATALATREDITATLAEASVPVLLLAGDKDPRLLSIRRTAAEIPGATLVELPGCGHLDAFVRTDLTLPNARHFLAEKR